MAVEPSSDMIRVARSYAQSQNLTDRISFIEGVVEDDAAISSLGKFDLIYSTFSLHHWKEPSTAIRNLYHALKEDGVILIFDFKRHWFTYYLSIRKGLKESIRASYTPGELIATLTLLQIQNYHVQTIFPYLSVLLWKSMSVINLSNSDRL